MPEYLAPGVYVEEVSFRAKSIEGVSTSVAAFIGPTQFGPVGGQPELLTSYADYTRIYGELYPLDFADAPNYVAHAVRAFFDNGGSMLYVTRVFEPQADNDGVAYYTIVAGTPFQGIRARFPGSRGNMRITFTLRAGPNVLSKTTSGTPTIQGLNQWDVVYISEGLSGTPAALPVVPSREGLYNVISQQDGSLAFQSPTGTILQVSDFNPPSAYGINRLTIVVSVLLPGRFEVDTGLGEFTIHPSSRDALTKYFTDQPISRLWALTSPFALELPDAITLPGSNAPGAQLASWLMGAGPVDAVRRSVLGSDALRLSPNPPVPSATDFQQVITLSSGNDGLLPIPNSYVGADLSRDPTGVVTEKTGLLTFEDVDEISIVAAPGYSANYADNPDRGNEIVQALITHVEKMRYRVAVLNSPDNSVLSEVQAFRGQFNSEYAALYYPWVRIIDPLDITGRREINLPPSGYVAGIYARSDVANGVSKAPANEVVLGAIRFEFLLNKAQQDILNPLGINCFRFFEGRGYRLWGARTISSDPDWKYISVRRYFAYLEHSIDKGTQYVVFSNNNEALWASVRRTIEDFLFNEWRNGALMGTKPEEAYFVRCDRSTMTQNDLDNGRLVCLIGVAPVKPAEFVIFRIGQWTASATT